VLDYLCERFGHVPLATWQSRIARGLVRFGDGAELTTVTAHRAGAVVHYFREVEREPRIPLEESVLHVDADLVVADKPPFVPVAPAGPWVTESLQVRLARRLGLTDLVPLHRLDRATAGIVLFSRRAASRARYHALFRDRRILKVYEALAPPLRAVRFPISYRSRLEAGEPFFRVREAPGVPNSETRIDVLGRDGLQWRYELVPVTGRKHQLRVHMAALGAPIAGDPYYPVLTPHCPDDFARPLALVARRVEFVDPVSGVARHFVSAMALSGTPVGD
jgi:tRNA pseudouridine32 synthase/23S rRNA pseudouridine746 synthase